MTRSDYKKIVLMEMSKEMLDGEKSFSHNGTQTHYLRANCGRCHGTKWANPDPIDLEHGMDNTGKRPCNCWQDIKQKEVIRNSSHQ